MRGLRARLLPAAADRRGAVLVEVALVGPIALLVLMGLLVGGIAVFRTHQLNALAIEGARWASAHGPQYVKDTGQPLPTKSDVYQNAIKPLAASLSEDQLQYDVVWNNDGTLVTVSLSYDWLPGTYGMNYTIKASAELPVSN